MIERGMDIPAHNSTAAENATHRDGERIAPSDLQRIVRATDRSALPVLPRILRRVIKQDRHLPGFAYRIPHRKSYVIDREPLLEIVDYEELGVTPEEGLPDKVILLAQPSPQKLEAMPAGAALVRSWRLLFHARVHLAIQQCFVLGFLSPSQLRKRIHQLGETEFEEIRSVLQQEGYLLPPREPPSEANFPASGDFQEKDRSPSPSEDAAAYEEFAAVFLELKYFAWNSLPRFFPDLRDLEAVSAVLELDVNAQAIFEASRPQGAPDPTDHTALEEIADWAVDPDERLAPSPPPVENKPSSRKFRRALRMAQRATALGNVVRTAINHAVALRFAPKDKIARAKTEVHEDVNRLIFRLQNALDLHDSSPQPWHDAISSLVYSAAEGFWTAEGRLLYDLQKVCIDHERDIYSSNLLGWLWSYCLLAFAWLKSKIARFIDREGSLDAATGPSATREITPIKQPLPNQRDVLKSQHLRSAQRRLAAVRLSDKLRKQLSVLLRNSIDRVESQLRERFRPLMIVALDEVGLKPANFPEKIARDKLIEELLDRVAERGFLSFGDLRDALSRNNMKLPDFGGAKDLYYGDPLLKADRRMGEILRGIYRSADFYLRWLQQLTSLGFGTRVGRFLTRYLAVPFGGAFLVHKFIDHIFDLFWPYKIPTDAEGNPVKLVSKFLENELAGVHSYRFDHLMNWLPLGLFIFGLFNSEKFRKFTWKAIKNCWEFLGQWLYQPLWRIVHSRWIQAILHSRPFRLFVRFVVKPMFWTAVIWFAVPQGVFHWPMLIFRAAVLFFALNLLLNSRVGRTLEEMSADWAVHTWQQYGMRLILGLFWWIVDFFKTMVETVERLMYEVDEWLRFKSGDSRFFFTIKAVLAVAWSGVAYVLRFCVNLLIEPQVNPIKHFPVVTVSHKLLLPLYPILGGIFAAHMEKELAYATATAIIWCIPGIFGFLVWELRENWRLYAANRPKGLQPMIIGSHGERMGRLLRPGLHSGTIPKLFAKLRRAERKARASGNWKAVRKHLQGLEHVEKSLRRFVERDFLATFNESRIEKAADNDESPLVSANGRVALAEIRFGTNRTSLLFISVRDQKPLAAIDFDIQSGWLVARVEPLEGVRQMAEDDREELATAIFGLFKTSGVEIARRQLELALPASIPAYDFSPAGLRIWPDASFETEVFYEFGDDPAFTPQVRLGILRDRLPELDRSRILFHEAILPWRNWVIFWDAVQAGMFHYDKQLQVFPLLAPPRD